MPIQIMGNDPTGAYELTGTDDSLARMGFTQDEIQRAPVVGAALPTPKVAVRRLTIGRRLLLGYDSAALVTGGVILGLATSVPLTRNPQVPAFRGERLLVDGAISTYFNIDEIKIGADSSFATTGAAPASTFAPEATDVLLGLKTAQQAMEVQLLVSNVSLAPKRFRASFIGIAVE